MRNRSLKIQSNCHFLKTFIAIRLAQNSPFYHYYVPYHFKWTIVVDQFAGHGTLFCVLIVNSLLKKHFLLTIFIYLVFHYESFCLNDSFYCLILLSISFWLHLNFKRIMRKDKWLTKYIFWTYKGKMPVYFRQEGHSTFISWAISNLSQHCTGQTTSSLSFGWRGQRHGAISWRDLKIIVLIRQL